MPTHFNILWRLASSSGWSLLAGLGAVALVGVVVWVVITLIRPGWRISPVGIVAGSLTLMLLSVQVVPAIGAYRLKSTVRNTQDKVNSLIHSELAQMGGVISENSSEYVDGLARQTHDYLDNFIRKALLIASVEALAGFSIVVFSMEKPIPASARNGRRGAPLRSNRTNHIITRNGKSHTYRSRRHRL